MLCRGGKLMHWILRPQGDKSWSADDYARAATLEARWIASGVSEDERRRLIPCAVWYRKFPGTMYDDATMKRLEELLCRN